MATSSILPFAQDPTANLLTDAQYAAESARTLGQQPGVASSKFNNKALKQASAVAVGVAQFLADRQTTNITDVLTAAQVAATVADAFSGRLSNVRVLTGAGTFTKSANAKHLEVLCIGAGGGGGASPATGGGQVSMASGGGGGSHCASFFLNATASSFSYSCGAGGGSNVAGGTTTFSYPGAVMSAPGGAQGNSGAAGSIPVAAPPAPNTVLATGGNIYNSTPSPAGFGLILTGGAAVSGNGGPSPVASGAWGSSGPGAGQAGQGYGAGGAGALTGSSSGANLGGTGAAGVIIVKEYF